MRLHWSSEDEAFRDELRVFIDEHAPPESLGRDYTSSPDEGVIPEWSRRWQATLFDHGWMIPSYPPELGGRNCTPVQTLLYFEELASRGIPRSLHFPGYAIVAPTLLDYGTPAQRELVPAAIRGDTVWCIGMSEPNAGSDLAGLTTRADEYDDHFVVNGQKVWTSYAMAAEKCCCYVRTDRNVPKHHGISLLIVDMDTPGIEVRPLRHINGAAEFAEVFFTDVVVPRQNLVGDLNGGWALTQGSLAHERAGLWVEGVARLEHTVDALIALARACGRDTDPVVRREIATLYEQVTGLRALGYQGFASFARGKAAPEHSYLKLATSELGKTCFELGMKLQEAYGAVTEPERGAEDGRWPRGFLVTFAGTIAGGASEIQRNIIATRVLGLPRG